jgi:hypothetical protein
MLDDPDDAQSAPTAARTAGPRRGAARGTLLLFATALLLASCRREDTSSFEDGNPNRITPLADGGSLEGLAEVERVGAMIDKQVAAEGLEGDSVQAGADSIETDADSTDQADDLHAEKGTKVEGTSRILSPSRRLGRYPSRAHTDIDCSDLGYAVRVDGADPYSLDHDGDGIGCEPYLGRAIPDSARL